LFHPLLKGAEYLFHCLSSARKSLYRSGILESVRPSVPVISIGNLTAGGTGKTPLVIALLKEFMRRGHHPLLLSRGYRSDRPWCLNVVSDGRRVLLPAEVSGDEQALILRETASPSGSPAAIACRDRASAAKYGVAKMGTDIVLLDDAFQYWKLERDLDIVIVDCTDPFGRMGLLPIGRLREPFSMISRAHIVVLSRTDMPGAVSTDVLARVIGKYNSGCEIFCSRHEISSATIYPGKVRVESAQLKGSKGFLFCGIGNPGSFEFAAESIGIEISGKRFFPDHHRYSAEDFREVIKSAGDSYIVTTAKDLINLPLGYEEMMQGRCTLAVLELSMSIDMKRLARTLEIRGFINEETVKAK
jgi:tetraacyldisaccharide 4'-kinase